MQLILYIPGTRGPGDIISNTLLLQSIKFLLLFVCKPEIIQILLLAIKQKAKARRSREMDMMSDFEKVDVLLGNDIANANERDISNVMGNSENQCDAESNLQSRENYSHENDFGHFVHENMIPRQDKFQETMETFTSEFNMRLSQEMDSMMSMMHSQISRAINTAIAGRVLTEIQNMVSSMPSLGNRDTEASLSPISQENTEKNSGFKTKIMKKD